MKLTPKQSRFVKEYLIDLNATRAAKSAGYSERTARQAGAQNLSKPVVAEAIEKAKRKREERTQIDADYVLTELQQIWEADITDVINPDWSLRPLPEWPRIWRRMTTPTEVKDLMERSKDGGEASWDKIGQLIKFKTADKLETLKKIGEHVKVKAFESKAQVSINVDVSALEQRLIAGRERARRKELERVN